MGSLEDELAAATQITKERLAHETMAMHDLDDDARAAIVLTVQALAPVLGNVRDAILRLAREIDELKTEKAKEQH